MRTKVLICAVALAAASAFTSMAQNVYSINVVGYINVPIVDGFNLVANQLDFDGTGIANTPVNVLGTNIPIATTVYGWSGSAYNIAAYQSNLITHAVGWKVLNGVSPTLNPGQGFWLSIPAGGSATLNNAITTVGQVQQSTGSAYAVNTNLIAAGGFSLLSSIAPLSGSLQTTLKYAPQIGDTVYQWVPTPAPGSYLINAYQSNLITHVVAWKLLNGTGPAEPSLSVGEGFWLNSSPSSVWSNYFVVGP